jgi:hypothetical protein
MPFQLPEFTPNALAMVARGHADGEADPAFSIAVALTVGGRACATVVSNTTGDEITIQLKAKVQQNGRWALVPASKADRVFVDVPHAEGGGGTSIGTVYLQTGLFFYATNVDRSRVGAAIHVMRTAVRQQQRDDKILPATACFACGAELRRTNSSILGFGPDCAKKLGLAHAYTNRHQAPGDESFGLVEACPSVRDGHHCVQPGDHELHRDADGRTWYYGDGEREPAQQQTVQEIVDRGYMPKGTPEDVRQWDEAVARTRTRTYADVGDINFPYDQPDVDTDSDLRVRATPGPPALPDDDLITLQPGQDPRDLI